VQQIIDSTGVTEVHTSARIRLPSTTLFRNEKMPEDFDIDYVDVEEIKRIKQIIQ
jgi:copper homeostasis protein